MRHLMAWLSVASLLALPFPASSAEAATSGLAASAHRLAASRSWLMPLQGLLPRRPAFLL